jgi:hypothetical protein
MLKREPPTKKCTKCNIFKFLTEFNKKRGAPYGRRSRCKQCRRIENKENSRKLRIEVLSYYSNSKVPFCKCCKTEFLPHLSIDHIDGKGNEHRKTLKSKDFYWWLKSKNFPTGFQVLCMNCNWAKGVNHCCPCQSVLPLGCPKIIELCQ